MQLCTFYVTKWLICSFAYWPSVFWQFWIIISDFIISVDGYLTVILKTITCMHTHLTTVEYNNAGVTWTLGLWILTMELFFFHCSTAFCHEDLHVQYFNSTSNTILVCQTQHCAVNMTVTHWLLNAFCSILHYIISFDHMIVWAQQLQAVWEQTSITKECTGIGEVQYAPWVGLVDCLESREFSASEI